MLTTQGHVAHIFSCRYGYAPCRCPLVIDLTSFDALKQDYWTCNVRFAMGIPVYDSYEGWPEPTRVCRAVTSLFFDTCLRCGMPRGWEKKRPGKTTNPAWRPAA